MEFRPVVNVVMGVLIRGDRRVKVGVLIRVARVGVQIKRVKVGVLIRE